MLRTNVLAIRLTRGERATIDRLAQAERLPASTLARRLLLQEADQRDLLLSEDKLPDQPTGQQRG